MTDQDQSAGAFGPNIRTIYVAKAVGLVVILIAIWSIKWFVSPTAFAAPITLVILLALMPTVAVAARPEISLATLQASFAVDIVAITAGTHFGGGVDQVSAPLLYSLIVAVAGTLVSGRSALATAAASASAYATLVWSEHRGWLMHAVTYSRPADRQAATVIMVTLYLFLVARAVAYVVAEIRASHRRAEELRVESLRTLSHDLKNPLAIIHGYAEMIQDADADADQRTDYARRIQRSVQQALDLVRNILDVSAIETAPITPQRVPLNLNDLAGQVCEHYRPAADAKGIRLSTVFAMGLPRIEADPELLGRAIGNLISNAVKYADQGGHVEMATGVNENTVTVTVHDNGAGIPEADLPQLFQKHDRAASGKRADGTGLGLYLVNRIAQVHGGTVNVTSAVGRGSTFVLALPVHPQGGLV